MADGQNKITDTHISYTNRVDQWRKVRDCIEGEDKIKKEGESYLPKPSAQDNNEYEAYKKRSSLYGVAERTLRGMNGMIFRNDPVFDIPDSLEDMREKATYDGYSLNILAQEVSRENLSVGRYGLLLDLPLVSNISTTPYIATYFAEDIINWEQQFIDGEKRLVRVVLQDQIDNPKGQDYNKYLELIINELGHYQVNKWIVKGESAAPMLEDEPVEPIINGKHLDYIPFVFVNPYDARPEIEKPPFLDLCNMNIAHYRNSADYEHALYLTAQPTPFVTGNFTEANKPNSIGGGTLWVLPEGGSAGMVEFSGAGISAQKDAMEDKEQRMASLGARMINDGKQRNESGDTARMRSKGEMSLLNSVVSMTEASLTKALKWAAEWMNSSPDDVVVRLNRDWVEARMEPTELTAVVQSWQTGAISRQTMHENLQRGEIIPVDRTSEDEKELIESEGGFMSESMGDLNNMDNDNEQNG